MSVLLEALSVVVRCSCLNLLYPGGVTGYENAAPNGTFCCDGKLTRLGFMVPQDVRAHVIGLQRWGFKVLEAGEFQDLAVVDEFAGPTAHCTWLEWTRHPAGFSAVWLVGETPSPTACPGGWTLGQSAKLKFISNSEMSGQLMPLVREGGSEVLLNLKTGKEISIGRTTTDALVLPNPPDQPPRETFDS
jgi:hypothetical protein